MVNGKSKTSRSDWKIENFEIFFAAIKSISNIAPFVPLKCWATDSWVDSELNWVHWIVYPTL